MERGFHKPDDVEDRLGYYVKVEPHGDLLDEFPYLRSPHDYRRRPRDSIGFNNG
jgi:hypothetical protein